MMIPGDDSKKVMAYYPIHYGKEYLEASIKSIEPCVDIIYIIYSSKPTHGFSTDKICPDTEEELFRIADKASDKVRWISVPKGFAYEAQHRDFVQKFTAGYDQLLAVDADEVWDTEALKKALDDAHELEDRYVQIDGFINFWRSFNHVCLDHFHPVRIHNLRKERRTQGCVKGKIYHFSTAQSEQIMRYKYSVFGHANEVRPDWLDKIFFSWKPGEGNLHPVSLDLWNAVEFDKNTLPEVLKNHVYFDKEVIQ